MAVAFKLKRSSVSGRAPDTGSLDYGELAVNTYDGVLYLKKNDGNGDTVIPIQQVTEYNLAIDNTPITNSNSNNLSGILRDLDSAINQNKSFEIGADDSTIRTVNPGESIQFLGGTGITTSTDAEGNITISATAGGGTSNVQSLYDLTNVDIDTNVLAEGDVIQWNGTSWVAGTATVGGTLDGGDADDTYGSSGITTGGGSSSSGTGDSFLDSLVFG